MRLPYDLLSQSYKKPDILLCDVDKTPMCKLQTTGEKGSFKFNAYSEISFETSRTYLDFLTGETKINQFYDKIETPRLIKLNGFGYFVIQSTELSNDGIKESQTVTAYSLEYTLSTKYLENFQINTGATESVEVGYAYDHYYDEENEDDYINYIAPVTLYNEDTPELSLLHLAIEKAYGWKIGHVDASLKTLSRKFEVDRQSIYDFLMNEVCEKFNCYILFDTEKNEINVYAESKTAKFIGDGVTNEFTLLPKFDEIGTVSVDGYKTTKWDYNTSTGVITLEDTPISGSHIEVIDGALTEWETDVFIAFENLAQEIEVSYDSDEIKTQLTVTYGDGSNIREANLGIPYLTDLSYYYTVDWMGQDLYDAYTAYMQKSQSLQADYKANSEEILDITNRQNFEEFRLSMGYGEASVLPTTVGTYYVRGGSEPNYYYTEVSLPADYDASVQYYKLNGTNLNTEKVQKLYEALQKYFKNNSLEDFMTDEEGYNYLTDAFSFMSTYKISNLYTDLNNAKTQVAKETAVNTFLAEMWNEVGRTPLQKSYKAPYEQRQTQLIDYSSPSHEDYSHYYTTVLILNSINAAIEIRTAAIDDLEEEYQEVQNSNAEISANLAMDQNFTEDQLIRLSAFIREDELQLDDIVETDEDSVADSFKIKEDAIEAGRIELHKISQPKLQFSMTMANIYALPAFEPIIGQFQLGNVIKVALRKDYIKQSRLLQIDLDFDNLSSLSVEFGELTNLRTQSDIHADLLGQAITAGKSVAQNSANWTKGSDTATSTDLRIQNGLLDAATVLKAMDATQGTEIDKYGIHLKKVNPDTGAADPRQGWIVNNMMAYTDDNWKTTKTVLGEFKLRGEANSRWGLLADAVIAGHVEGSHIIGGDIKIGDIGSNSFPFTVNSNGDMVATSAVIQGDSSIAGWNVTNKYIDSTVSGTSKRLYLSSASDSSSNWIGAIDANGKTTFYVSREGKVYAVSGEIAGFTLSDNSIRKDKESYDSNTNGVYLGTNGIGLGAQKFYVTSEGELTATNATIGGASTIAGWNVTDNCIDSQLENTYKRLYLSSASDTSDDTSANWICATDDQGKETFCITKDGAMSATKGYIGGWTIDNVSISGSKDNCVIRLSTDGVGDGNKNVFYISKNSKNVTSIKGDGTFVTKHGEIGKWNIYESGITSSVDLDDGTKCFFTLDSLAGGSDDKYWIKIENQGEDIPNALMRPFYVNGKGKLYANNAEIKGKITATEGQIGGCNIENGVLQVGNANITSLNATKISGGTISTDILEASSALTTRNFSSEYLSTDRLTVLDGASIGDWYVSDSFLSIVHRTGAYGISLTNEGVSYGNGTIGDDASWVQIVSVAMSSSDIRLKNSVDELNNDFDKIFDGLKPVKFRYNNQPNKLRIGFVAQDVKSIFEQNGIDDFGGLFLDYREDGEYYNLIKEEFISLNTWQIQKLKTRVAELENRLAALEERN